MTRMVIGVSFGEWSLRSELLCKYYIMNNRVLQVVAKNTQEGNDLYAQLFHKELQ
jgi:hypothetical protein